MEEDNLASFVGCVAIMLQETKYFSVEWAPKPQCKRYVEQLWTLNIFLLKQQRKKQTNGTADKLEILGHYPNTEFLKVKDKGKSAY